MIRKIVWASCLVLAVAACNADKLPKDVMTPDALKPVLWDLFATGDLKLSDTSRATRMHLKDSVTAAFTYVLRIHNMTKDQFIHSFKYYEAHPDRQSILIDTLIAYNERQVKLYEKKQHKADSLRRSKTDTASMHKPRLATDTSILAKPVNAPGVPVHAPRPAKAVPAP